MRDVGNSGTTSERIDLGGVEPGQRQPGGPERRNVEEQARGGALSGSCCAGNEAGKGKRHREALADGAPDEQFAAASALNHEPRHGGKYGVGDHVDAAQDKRRLPVHAQRLLHQDGKIVDDGLRHVRYWGKKKSKGYSVRRHCNHQSAA